MADLSDFRPNSFCSKSAEIKILLCKMGVRMGIKLRNYFFVFKRFSTVFKGVGPHVAGGANNVNRRTFNNYERDEMCH